MLFDRNYINNITFGMKVLRGICNTVKCEVSVHLMVTNPLQYLEEISQMKHIGIVFFSPGLYEISIPNYKCIFGKKYKSWFGF